MRRGGLGSSPRPGDGRRSRAAAPRAARSAASNLFTHHGGVNGRQRRAEGAAAAWQAQGRPRTSLEPRATRARAPTMPPTPRAKRRRRPRSAGGDGGVAGDGGRTGAAADGARARRRGGGRRARRADERPTEHGAYQHSAATNTSPPRVGSAAQSERDRRVRGSRPNTAGGQARLRGAIHGLQPPPCPRTRARGTRVPGGA